MRRIYDFIFKSTDTTQSLMLLFGRVAFGLSLFQHGIAKFQSFDTLKDVFPDPIGLGSTLSVSLVIFAEMFCSLAVVAGFLQRLALVPIIITMCVAFFFAHNGSFAEGELALTYLFASIMLIIGGAGRYSVDHWLYNSALNIEK